MCSGSTHSPHDTRSQLSPDNNCHWVQPARANRLQPGQFHKPVQQNDTSLLTRMCQLYQTGGITGDQCPFVLCRSATQRLGKAESCCRLVKFHLADEFFQSPPLPSPPKPLPLSSFCGTTARLSIQGRTCKVQTLARAYLTGLSCCTQKAIIPPRR